MEKFTTLTAIAAPLNMINVDTDMIIPKQFLRTIKRTGLGIHLFNDMRYRDNGSENPDFILNMPPFKHAQILVAGDNFGCGSSREHAPWALSDFGITCVIAPSFADIFYNNSFKNGLLPVTLPKDVIDTLMARIHDNPALPLTIDLETQTVKHGNAFEILFDIDPFRKHCLLNGLDDISLTLDHENDIRAFETRDTRPWLYTAEKQS